MYRKTTTFSYRPFFIVSDLGLIKTNFCFIQYNFLSTNNFPLKTFSKHTHILLLSFQSLVKQMLTFCLRNATNRYYTSKMYFITVFSFRWNYNSINREKNELLIEVTCVYNYIRVEFFFCCNDDIMTNILQYHNKI